MIEGSARKANNRVRITARLIEAVTGNHLWAERYDRELADVFAVQDEITQNVVATIAPGQPATVTTDAFPGREVVAVPCAPLLEQHGSLHCLTMQIPRGVLP